MDNGGIPVSNDAAPSFTNDHYLVARLVEGDDAAWGWLLDNVVYPLFRANAMGIREICARNSVSESAVASRLYKTLSRNDFELLRNFRFECALRSWICWYLRDSAQRALREVTWSNRYVALDPCDLDSLDDASAVAPASPLAKRELYAGLNAMLAALWRIRPLAATVLLLRGELGLPSKVVAGLVSKSPAAIDQIYHRAQKSLRDAYRAMFETAFPVIGRKDARGMSNEAGRLMFADAGKGNPWRIDIILTNDGIAAPPGGRIFQARLYGTCTIDAEFQLCGTRTFFKHGIGGLRWDDVVAGMRERDVSLAVSGRLFPGQPIFASLVGIE